MRKHTFSLYIFWLCFVSFSVFAEEPRLYSGEIQVPTLGALKMTLGVSETDEGTVLLLTVPAQNAENIPLLTSYTKEGAISAELPQASLTFVVFENDERTRLTGEMNQGLVFEIDFTRVDEIAQLVRPQNPIGPYPYSDREVTAKHPEGHLLQGTLTIPKGRGPFPCAVLISGSGQQDRDESLMGHKPFLVIADYLTRRGIAVLRYDDRGIGGSVMEDLNDLKEDTSEDFATDALLMVQAARMHTEIDSKRVGVIGHSEGGLIGPMVALNDDKLAFVVMLAGPGVVGYELLGLQQGLLFETAGVKKELVDEIVNASLSVYEMLQGGANDDELLTQVEELVSLQLLAQDIQCTEEEFAEFVAVGLESMTLPWTRFFLFYDPLPTLEKVSCPVLAMNGTKDLQVDANQNLTAIETLIAEYGSDITIVRLEGLNHLFQAATTGAVSEYGQIETTFEPEALSIMADWIVEVSDNGY
jgi:hypothetical protein